MTNKSMSDCGVLQPMQNYSLPVITLGKDTPKEAVCQVFENVNQGGVKLTVFELVTASFAAEGMEPPLREDWFGDAKKKSKGRFERNPAYESVKKLLSAVSDVDFLVAVTLLSKYCTKKIIGESAPAVSCKRKDVLELALSDYLSHADSLTNGFISAAHFLMEQCIYKEKDLPYTTQLIPLAVMLTALGKRANDSTVKSKISKWYWCGVFGEMYGGANETRYVNDIVGVIDWINNDNSVPETVARASFQPERLLSLQTRNSAAYKGVMALLLKEGTVDFISGTEMDFTNFIEKNIDIHHIFPSSYCENLYPREKWNSIVNKTPQSAETNRTLGGESPSKYLKRISEKNRVLPDTLNQHLETHFIDIASLRDDNFDSYFIKRAKSLLKLISHSMGKQIEGLSSKEVIKQFGESLEDTASERNQL